MDTSITKVVYARSFLKQCKIVLEMRSIVCEHKTSTKPVSATAGLRSHFQTKLEQNKTHRITNHHEV
jgi:hypothetical protein